jgi:tetratricopeptide (TPR) repeat protein
VDPSVGLFEQVADGRLEGVVLMDRTSTYRDGTRVGWTKIKDCSRYEREAWRFDRRKVARPCQGGDGEMGVRYRKSIRLGGGARVNLSRSGVGFSMGIPGFRVGVGGSGRVTRTLGIPGTGLHSVSTIGSGGRRRSSASSSGGAGRSGQVTVPASQASQLLPKPGWLAGAADKWYYEGVQAYLQGEYQRALRAFQACLAADPAAVSAHLFAALCVGKVDGPDVEQIEHLEAVVTSSDPIPDRLEQKYLPEGLVTLGMQVSITDVISGDAPFDSVGATLMLAELYQKAGRLEEAVGLIQQLHEADPANLVVRLSLADLYLAGLDHEGVLDAASTATNDSDVGVALLHMRAAALTDLGHMEGALASFAEALAKTAKRDPDLLKVVRYDRAFAFEKAGQPKKAKADLERLYAGDPAFLDVRERLTSLL